MVSRARILLGFIHLSFYRPRQLFLSAQWFEIETRGSELEGEVLHLHLHWPRLSRRVLLVADLLAAEVWLTPGVGIP